LGTLQTKLEAALRDATTLEITTIIGDITMEEVDGKFKPKAEGTKTMYTKIDLLDGDIVTMIDNAFVSGDLVKMREHHEAVEVRANKIIQDNIATLQALLKAVKDLIKDQ
jgi:hypothetical protein